MKQADIVRIAKEFADKNARIAFGDVLRVQLLLVDEMRRIDPADAEQYATSAKVWSVVFQLKDSEIIPKTLVVEVDDQSGKANFFKNM